MNWFKPKSGPLTASAPLTPRVRQFCARVWSFLNKPRGPRWLYSEKTDQELEELAKSMGKITFRKWRHDDPMTLTSSLCEALWLPKIEIEIPPESDEAEEEEEEELDEATLALLSSLAKDPVADKKFREHMRERAIYFEMERNVQEMIARREAFAAAIERGKNENGTGWRH
jgi:hypothetical protein